MTGTVGIVLHEAAAGGASRAALAPVAALTDAGWRFTFWVPSPGPMADELRGRGYRVAGAPRLLRYSLAALREPPGPARRLASTPGYARAFGAWLRRERPDVVHANTLLTLPEAMLARGLGRRTLLHVHEMLPGDLRGRGAALFARRCDAVIGVSEACGAALGALGIEADVVRLGVPQAVRPRRAPGPRPVIGALGTVSHRKGADLFVALAERLAVRGLDVELRMIGPPAPGPDAPWARAVLSRAARAGVVCGITGDPAGELAGWDLLVLPTRADPFPLVVLEAMASGVPVVASAVDGVPEQLGSDGGVLVPPEDLGALERAVVTLVGDPDRRSAFAAAGRARVRSVFTPERHAAGMAAAYDRVLRGARPVGRPDR